MILEIIIASLLVALASLSGRVLMIFLPPERFEKFRVPMLSIATGTFLGLVLFDLLPESFESLGSSASFWIFFGMLAFFILEKFFLGYHHAGSSDNHSMHTHTIKTPGKLVLVGDAVHNFLDGVAIAGAFTVSTTVGILTSVSVILHEIPQEIGDMMVLMLSGFTRAKAMFWNFIFALATLLGAVFTISVVGVSNNIVSILVAMASGGFLYIAMADLMPETKHEERFSHGILHTVLMVLGLGIIVFVRWLVPEM